jgi:tetratricopeptide (TPR) repeat protein
MGLRSQRAAIRAEALYRQGRYSEAERSASAAREQAPSDNVEAQGFWRLVRAKLLAQKGEFQEAEELARQGLALFRPTDHLHDHCDALLALAEVLRLRGKNGEAAAATEDAIRLYER